MGRRRRRGCGKGKGDKMYKIESIIIKLVGLDILPRENVRNRKEVKGGDGRRIKRNAMLIKMQHHTLKVEFLKILNPNNMHLECHLNGNRSKL